MADATKPSTDDSGAARGRCPICRAASEAAFRPFCSRRCSDVDLSRWLTGSYAIAGGDSDADEDGDDAAAQGMRRNPAPDEH